MGKHWSVARPIPHDLPVSASADMRHSVGDVVPKVEVLQISADGADSFYQVQVNAQPEGELVCRIRDDHTARIYYKVAGSIVDWTDKIPLNKDWVAEAHLEIQEVLRKYIHPDITIGWLTRWDRGANFAGDA